MMNVTRSGQWNWLRTVAHFERSPTHVALGAHDSTSTGLGEQDTDRWRESRNVIAPVD